jgi:cobalt-zinc-cadmium efflux system outer membrane protein
MVSVPIDWLLFGKRAQAMQAARLGIDSSKADFTHLQRTQVARTVDAFYEVLADEEFLKLARSNHEELKAIEARTQELVKMNKAGKVELDRLKLAILEAFLEIHERERILTAAKARLRPLIGRSATDPDFELDGSLAVTAVVPPPKLAEALALADAHRADLQADQHAIAQARSLLELARRRAKPQIAIIPGWSYQNQHYIDGFRNGSMFDIGISTTLPITDRNQGNIAAADSKLRELAFAYQGNRADALAEVEAALADYEDAVEDITKNNTPETRAAALALRAGMEKGYLAGQRSLVDLLNAHIAYRTRLAHEVEFAATYWRQLNRLNLVVGINAYDQERSATVPVKDKK